MLKGKQGALVIEHADVVGGPDLVDLCNQRLWADHVPDAHAGQPKLAHGAHQQHMAVFGNAVDIALA